MRRLHGLAAADLRRFGKARTGSGFAHGHRFMDRWCNRRSFALRRRPTALEKGPTGDSRPYKNEHEDD
jgi:hypothetical protein